MLGLKQIHEEFGYFILSKAKYIKIPKAVREISGVEKLTYPPKMEYFIPDVNEKAKHPERHLIIILSKAPFVKKIKEAKL